MSVIRYCSRPGCCRPAVATLEFNYAEQRAVIGPLAAVPYPHRWDLCEEHAARTSVPKGWELTVREDAQGDDAELAEEEMLALAHAVQQAQDAKISATPEPLPRVVRREDIPEPSGRHPARRNLPSSSPKRHLRALKLDT